LNAKYNLFELTKLELSLLWAVRRGMGRLFQFLVQYHHAQESGEGSLDPNFSRIQDLGSKVTAQIVKRKKITSDPELSEISQWNQTRLTP